jgi:hypothetical protein
MISLHRSYNKKCNGKNDPIFLIQQFFIPENPKRRAEISDCLKRNAQNPHIKKIFLLNEREYTNSELGMKTDELSKIEQIVIYTRLRYDHVFEFVSNKISERAYIIFSNSDIFFDKTLDNLKSTALSTEKAFMAQLRFEFAGENNLMACKLFTQYTTLSQDTWIYHTSNQKLFELGMKKRLFNFHFGKPGCDNKMLYLVRILGMEIINDPFLVKTYHHHASGQRSYTQKDTIEVPWIAIAPVLPKTYYVKDNAEADKKISLKSDNFARYDFVVENDILSKYIKSKLDKHEPFILPRIAGGENNLAVMVHNNNIDLLSTDILNQTVGSLKNSAGLKFSNMESIKKYGAEYFDAFYSCERYFDWEMISNMTHIEQSQQYLVKEINRRGRKLPIWAFCMDIFNVVRYQPWTWALRNKKILIVSAFCQQIKRVVESNLQPYEGIDLFPGCTFEYIQPPQTLGTNVSDEWDVELQKFYSRLDQVPNDWDVALVSSGGYGNPICNEIFKKRGKSAIYVGGVLQMYFGILGSRWVRERPDIVKLYQSSVWARPDNIPRDAKNIEDSCYW